MIKQPTQIIQTNSNTWARRSKLRLMIRIFWLLLSLFAVLWSIGLYYNFKAGDPIMLTNSEVVATGKNKQAEALIIIADSILKPSLEQISQHFSRRYHNLDIEIHYTKNNVFDSQNIASTFKHKDIISHHDINADLWLNFNPDNNQFTSATQKVDRFDFAIAESSLTQSNLGQAQHHSDGHTISTKPNTPPLSGMLISEKQTALNFKNFLLSSVAQDVFVAHGLQSIEPRYATKTFFTISQPPSYALDCQDCN